jgi:predicted Zn-dependent protease
MQEKEVLSMASRVFFLFLDLVARTTKQSAAGRTYTWSVPDFRSKGLFQGLVLPRATVRRVGSVLLFAAWAAYAAGQSSPLATSDGFTSEVQQANDDLASGRYQSALERLDRMNTSHPGNAEVLYDLGLADEALNPNASADPKAEANYRAAIAADPKLPLPHVALGLLLARSARDTEAREQFQIVITQGLDAAPALKARALRALARLDLNGHRAAEASGELAAALQLSAETPDDTLLAAEIAEAVPDTAAAEESYRRYLAARPVDPYATSSLAHLLLNDKHGDEAESLLQSALAAHPGDPVLTTQLAQILLASSDPVSVAKAAPLVAQLHAAKPGDASLTLLLGHIYLQQGETDKAEEVFSAAIASAGANADPRVLTAESDLLMRANRPAAAEKLLQQAVSRPAGFDSRQQFAEAALRLAFAAQETDDPRGTLHALELRATVLPPSLATLFLEATARDALHQSSQAVDLYKRFLAEAHGTLPQQETKAKERLAVLQRR